MPDNQTNMRTRERGWPPSRRLTTVLLLLALYMLVSAVTAYDHADMVLRGAIPSDSGWDPNYFNFGNMYASVYRIPFFAALSALSALFAILFLIAGLFARPFSGMRYGLLEVTAFFPAAFTLLVALFVVPGIFGLRHYDIASRPGMQTKVCKAARDNKPEALAKLIAEGADPDAAMQNPEGDMIGALSYACIAGNEKCVDILLNAGASPIGAGEGTRGGITALDHAVLHGRVSIVKKLMQHGANPNWPTSLVSQNIVASHNYEIAELLLKSGMSKTVYDSCVYESKECKDVRMLKVLKKYKPGD